MDIPGPDSLKDEPYTPYNPYIPLFYGRGSNLGNMCRFQTVPLSIQFSLSCLDILGKNRFNGGGEGAFMLLKNLLLSLWIPTFLAWKIYLFFGLVCFKLLPHIIYRKQTIKIQDQNCRSIDGGFDGRGQVPTVGARTPGPRIQHQLFRTGTQFILGTG